MIKKFNEYLKENLDPFITKHKHLGDFITKEDIEDQFLRLEEVFGCRIKYSNVEFLNQVNNCDIFIMEPTNGVSSLEKWKKILKEISQIEHRIEGIYSPLKVTLSGIQKATLVICRININI